jgi:RNA polymerase sigma factor (sigma-70 family)
MSIDTWQRGLDTEPDARLVELAGAGRDDAFAVLVGRYRREVLSYCRRFENRSASAEDIFQQALLNAWRAIVAGREVGDVRPWLYRIAHNVAVDGLRRPLAPPLAVPEDRPASTIEDELEQRAAVRQALAGMAALPSPQREVMLDSTIGGLSYEELASSHGLSVAAIRGLIYRARATLRAAAAALLPAPLVNWLARRASEGSAPLAGGLAGGGSVALGSAWLKGGAVLAAAGALAGIAVQGPGHRTATGHRHAGGRRVAARTAPAASTSARAGLSVAAATPGRGRTVLGPPAASAGSVGGIGSAAVSLPRPRTGGGRGPGTGSTGSDGGPNPGPGSTGSGSSGSRGGPGPSSGSGGGPGPSPGDGSGSGHDSSGSIPTSGTAGASVGSLGSSGSDGHSPGGSSGEPSSGGGPSDGGRSSGSDSTTVTSSSGSSGRDGGHGSSTDGHGERDAIGPRVISG